MTLPDICHDIANMYLNCQNNSRSDTFLCQKILEINTKCLNYQQSGSGVFPQPVSIIIVCCLVILSGLFSGLTLGLLGLDIIGLKIVLEAGSDKLRLYAKRISGLRKHGNWLLCTLLLGNVAVNAALAVLMDQLFKGNELVGFFVSTGVITIIGEIFPQAVCARHALFIGYHTAYLVKMIMILMAPIAWPLSKILDLILGEELGTIYNNDELKQLIHMHIQLEKAELGEEVGKIMSGALDYSKLIVSDIMTLWNDVYKLKIDEKLTFDVLIDIFKSGHSRIPCVNNDDQMSGLLFVKDLILIDPEDETNISDIINLYNRNVPVVYDNQTIQTVMHEFQTGRSHLAVVQSKMDKKMESVHKNIGIITLEDIVEAILNVEIVDETDVYIDVKDKKPVHRQPFDISKLNVFDYRRRLPLLSITPQELQASFLHLTNSVDVFDLNKKYIDSRSLKRLINKSPVIHVLINANELESVDNRRHKGISEGGLCLYEEGVSSDVFSLILDGKVEIFSSKTKNKTIISRWSTLNEEVLNSVFNDSETKDDEYTLQMPFTAVVIENSRIMQIKKASFQDCLGLSINKHLIQEYNRY